MIKLYKQQSRDLLYWEAWNTEKEITIHWGIVGSRGSARHIKLLSSDDPSLLIQFEAAEPRAQGYAEIAGEQLTQIAIQFRIDGMGTTDDLEKRYQVEERLNHSLGWTGLGHCDGGDIGSGTMNVFCFVVDQNKALELIREELRDLGCLKTALIAAISDEGEEVLWPVDFQGHFSL